MIELEIIDKNNFNYVLKSNNEEIYNFILEFHDIEKLPEIGDKLYFSEELLNKNYEGYSNFYVFGDLKNEYGRENILLSDIDVIKITINNKEVFLKRLYG